MGRWSIAGPVSYTHLFYFVFRENELIGYNFLIGDTKKYKAFPWLAISNMDEQKLTVCEELTHTLLREFVEKIVVHECSYDENGTRRQDIEDVYKRQVFLFSADTVREAMEELAE